MSVLYENLGHIILMLILLCCSAFFSGTETACFNLSLRQRRLLAGSKHRLQRLTARLLDNPSQMLSCLLLGNMTVNVLFFATASVLTIRLKEHATVAAATIAVVSAFTALVMFGEILPKTLAYANSRSISIAAALPLFVCIKISAPLLLVFRLLMVEPALGLLLGHKRSTRPINLSDLKLLTEQMCRRGIITDHQNKLLFEIMELGMLKVRHVMLPRVDMITCPVTESAAEIIRKMRKHRLTRIPIYAEKIDNIVGLVHLRDLLLEPDATTDKLVRDVQFVPEQKTVESLLEHFRHSRTDMAVVVDEYGGIAGSVRLEDIAEELLGDIESATSHDTIEQVGPFQYRLAGGTPIHDWAEAFGIDLDEMKVSTVGGLVTQLLGRIAETGDQVSLQSLNFRVERVSRRRIKSIILTIEHPQADA